MNIAFPQSGAKRALLVIDVQPDTLRSDAAQQTLALIRSFVEATHYDAYVVATYSAPHDSMFYRQSGWHLPEDVAGPSDTELDRLIATRNAHLMHNSKTVRSVFKGPQGEAIKTSLRERGIDEVHIVGFDINDCLLATAYDALDEGFFTYVIEECSGRTDGNADVIGAALTILRRQNMTNQSTRLERVQIEI